MKKKIVVQIIGIALIAGISATTAAIICNKHTSGFYPKAAVVKWVSQTTDTVCAVDGAGNMWEFRGAEDWETGDIAAFLMNDKGTPEITDDEIVKVRYTGNVYGFFDDGICHTEYMKEYMEER